MKLNGFAALILVFVLFLPFGTTMADSGWVNNEGCYCGTYNPYPVDYISRGCGTAAERNAARDQMSYWNLYSTIYTPSVATGLGAPGNGSNEVNAFITESDASSIYGYTMSPSLYGVAIIQPDANFGNFNECQDFDATGCDDFTETDVLINSAFSNGWTTDPNNYCGPALVQTTALHEIGHTWGAHHVFALSFGDSYSTMNYINDDSGRFVARMDANTIRAAYPATAQTITDVGIFPFVFGNSSYGETYASVSPTTVSAGGSITVSNYLIQNIGTNAAADTVVSFYLSTDTTITSGDILLGTAGFGTLAVNADSDQSATLTIPGSVADGVYYIGAIVTVGGSEDSVTINNRFIIGRPVRTLIFVGGGGCLIEDGGFETGTPNSYWDESSTNFSTPVCSVALCGSVGSDALSGTYWAWFGGVTGAVEEGALQQSVTIASGTQYLNFYLEIPTTDTTGYLRVLMDGTNIFQATHADGSSYSTYRAVSIDISAYADDGSHTLRFESRTEAGSGALNFFVDDVCLNATAFSDGIDCSAGGSSCSGSGGDGDGGSSGCFIGRISR